MRNGAFLPAETGELDDDPDPEWSLSVEELAELLRVGRVVLRNLLDSIDTD